MTARLIDGTALGKQMREQVRHKIAAMHTAGRRSPCLAVLLVGDDSASQVYVGHKEKACAEVGITSRTFRLPADTDEDVVLKIIRTLNEDDHIDGILPQLPMPPQIDRVKVIAAIDPAKDVDGLTFYNQGRLAWNLPALRPCTPAGVMEILRHANVNCAGKHAVVVGRSVLVGLPTQLLLLHANATVTCVHSKSTNPAATAQRADILIAAAGSRHLINRDWIKPGAVVIDVGIHRGLDGKLTGDVNPNDARSIASIFTPVPGGVGPMTIAMLMVNCLEAFERRRGAS
jgi:methylenetetrahydrofolate dehydrogenase (NADP+)/methenyltetrahydrofolate cyclohydrolase